MASEWVPANDTEHALAAALRDDVMEEYVARLLTATLYLPSGPDPAATDLLTFTVGDERYLMAFTSPDALARQLRGVPAFRTTTCAELVEKWPDETWQLAIDPGLPIQAYLPVDVLAGVGAVELARNEVEDELAAAVAAEDLRAAVAALLLATVFVPVAEPTGAAPGDPDFPWAPVDVDGPAVVAFTSAAQLDDLLSDDAFLLELPFVDLVMDWPDPQWRLVVNPASELEVTVTGEEMGAVLDLAAELVSAAGPEADPTSGGDAPAAALGRPTPG
ncbi:hypothetical protein GCM10009682_32270 [Luedemannella flava]|uniref:SseB protein N-terminal domain-containing protein n=1 Tax=Luedemannella flava TaxID=349316 RepID=A0ABP4YBA2_9ACTN